MTTSDHAKRQEPRYIENPVLYGWQLTDVVLWELNVARTGNISKVTKAMQPAFRCVVDAAAPEPGRHQRIARMSVEYRFPQGDAPDYVVKVEQVGFFSNSGIIQETSAGEHGEHPIETRQPQIPLNDQTVMSLLWPYMREILQQIQLRMRVPVRLLPTLDMANLQPGNDDSETA